MRVKVLMRGDSEYIILHDRKLTQEAQGGSVRNEYNNYLSRTSKIIMREDNSIERDEPFTLTSVVGAWVRERSRYSDFLRVSQRTRE
jgi:hypothetical protein